MSRAENTCGISGFHKPVLVAPQAQRRVHKGGNLWVYDWVAIFFYCINPGENLIPGDNLSLVELRNDLNTQHNSMQRHSKPICSLLDHLNFQILVMFHVKHLVFIISI